LVGKGAVSEKGELVEALARAMCRGTERASEYTSRSEGGDDEQEEEAEEDSGTR